MRWHRSVEQPTCSISTLCGADQFSLVLAVWLPQAEKADELTSDDRYLSHINVVRTNT